MKCVSFRNFTSVQYSFQQLNLVLKFFISLVHALNFSLVSQQVIYQTLPFLAKFDSCLPQVLQLVCIVCNLVLGIMQVYENLIFLFTFPSQHFFLQSCRGFQIANSCCELASRIVVLRLKAFKFTL